MIDYGIDQVRTLEGMEAVRTRPGMYIASVGQAGIQHITLEVISNGIDEYLAGCCTNIDIIVKDDNTVIISDNGRGIPFADTAEGKQKFIDIVSKLHTGAKFDPDGKTGYNSSGGQNGIGIKATNALSDSFIVTSMRDGKRAKATYSKGKLKGKVSIENIKSAGTGTTIEFHPDATIFKETISLDYDALRKQVKELSFLSPGLTFNLTFKDKPTEEIVSKNGLLDYIAELNGKKKSLTSTFYCETLENRMGVKIAMLYNDSYSDNYKLYTNSIPNSAGTHLTGFRTALTTTINNYARENGFLKDKDSNLTGEELKEGLVLILSFIMPDPVYSGQTKDALTSSEARTIVSRLVSKELENWFAQNPNDAKAIINKALNARKAREAAKKAKDAIRQPKEKGLKAKLGLSNKFIDCISKKPAERNLLLVEGLSAGSAAIEARNAKTDCIYMLRGK